MSDFDRVKQSIDLADYIGRYAAMKRAGTVMQCCCPLPGHNDKTPSFQVKGDQWICRGKCGVGGDIFDFVQRYHGWTLAESLQELARYAGITLEPLSPEAKHKQDHKERLYALMEEATSYYHALLYTGGPFLNYLIKERGLSDETIKQARIGYAPGNLVLYKQMQQLGYTYQDLLDTGLIKPGDKRPYDTFSNRLMIPICDAKGRVVAFSGRAYSPDHGPKYLHNATNDIFHKSEIVHRMPVNPSKMGIEAFNTIIAVEGTIDPVSALNRGFYNVVSLLGKSLSEDQLNTLHKLGMQRLVFCLDRDESGRNALRTLTHKHAALLASKGIELYAMFAPHGKDPDDTFREKPELWQPAVDAARPVVDVLIDLELSALGPNATAAQKSKMAGDLLPILKSDNPFVMDENFNILSSRTGIAVDALKNWAMPQMELLPKAVPAIISTKTNAPNVPTLEEWVVHGLLVNEDEDWLTRANTRLLIASVDNLPYALAPLSIQDFTDAPTRRLMDLILKGESPADLYVDGKLELALRKPYERIATLDSIGRDYNLSFDFNVFVDAVYELRIARLIADKDSSKSRECARAIACLRLAQEDLIEA